MDMLKHIQAEHLHRIAIDENLNLSEGGRRFDPDRIGYDIENPVENTPLFAEDEINLETRINKILQVCTLSDLALSAGSPAPYPDRDRSRDESRRD